MTIRSLPSTRRTEGVRTRGRSARVVAQVLRATAEELGVAGYMALRIENVAARSGVNKTTIYRRWPTKQELVEAAVSHLMVDPTVPDTGSIETDLAALLWQTVAGARTPLGRGLLRVVQIERGDPEVDALARRLRAEKMKRHVILVERAVGRGELPAATDARLLLEIVTSTVLSRITRLGEPVDQAFVSAVVDVVVQGARARAARSGRPPGRRSAPTS